MKRDRHGQAEPITDDIYQRIRNAFLEESHQVIFDILYYTGERISAVLQLAVGDVYQDAITRKVREEITFKAQTRKDKTTRQVPIHKSLKLKLRAFTPPTDGYLFPTANGHLLRQSYDAAFRRALVRVGLDKVGYSLHSTRRGFITTLHAKGVPIKTIQTLTGHKSLNTLSRYVDVTDEMKRIAISLL